MGRATAQAWAQAGAFITIADIQPLERGTAIVNELGAEVGPRCKYVYCDVIKWESQVSAVQAAFAASPLCVQPGGLLDLIEAAGEATRRQAPPPPA
jgi:5'-hydroxyaverantin dehydrogenase